MLIIIAIIGFLIAFFFTFTAFMDTKIKGSMKEITKGFKKKFLENIDFSEGNYAIIIDNQEPPILIDDTTALLTNKDAIKVDVSWLDYLPGVGPYPKGIRLFKDNELLREKTARTFKTFDMGTLREFGKPIAFKSINETKDDYLRKKTPLKITKGSISS